MAIDIKAALSKPANAAKFTGAFIAAYMSPAFGTRSKTEIDLLVLVALGKKAAGEAGGALADELLAKPAAEKAASFLRGLLSGDAKGAAKGLAKEDIVGV